MKYMWHGLFSTEYCSGDQEHFSNCIQFIGSNDYCASLSSPTLPPRKFPKWKTKLWVFFSLPFNASVLTSCVILCQLCYANILGKMSHDPR